MADKRKSPKKPVKTLKERRQEKRRRIVESGEFLPKRKRG